MTVLKGVRSSGGWGVLPCVLGTVLVIQSDSRKEGHAFALSCTPEETRSVAARAAQCCQRLGSLSLAKQDLWLNYILCSFVIWKVQITGLISTLNWVRFNRLVNLRFFCTIFFSLLLLILSNKTSFSVIVWFRQCNWQFRAWMQSSNLQMLLSQLFCKVLTDG